MLDFDGVRRLLPHAHPFLFIDRVLDFVPYESIECLKNVSGSEPYFAGHFPEIAVMPGALIMEAIAQASVLLFQLSAPGEEMLRLDPDQLFVVGSSRSRFLLPVVPGDALRLSVNVSRIFPRAALVRARGTVGDRLVVTASLGLARLDRARFQRSLATAEPERVGSAT